MLRVPNYGPDYRNYQNPPISQNPFFFTENPGIVPPVNPPLGEILSFNRMGTPSTVSVNPLPMGVGFGETGYTIPNHLRGNASQPFTSSMGKPPESFLDSIGLNQHNIGIFGGLASGLASLGGAYSSWKGAKLANKQFNYNRGMMDTQYENALHDYNRRLSDTARSRNSYYTGVMNDPDKPYESEYTKRWEAKDNRKK